MSEAKLEALKGAVRKTIGEMEFCPECGQLDAEEPSRDHGPDCPFLELLRLADEEVRLVSLAAEVGRVEVTVEIGHRLRLLLAEFMAKSLGAEGAQNYVSWEVLHPEAGPFEMIAQRVCGKRPAVVAAEERARADAAEAEVKRLREMIAQEASGALR